MTKTYEYDAYGNLAVEKQNRKKVREYTWAAENRPLTAKVYDAYEVLAQTVAFRYDDQGTRVKRTATEGTQTTEKRYLTDYQNPTGYSQTLQELDLSATEVQAQYTYGGTGLISQASSLQPPDSGLRTAVRKHSGRIPLWEQSLFLPKSSIFPLRYSWAGASFRPAAKLHRAEGRSGFLGGEHLLLAEFLPLFVLDTATAADGIPRTPGYELA